MAHLFRTNIDIRAQVTQWLSNGFRLNYLKTTAAGTSKFFAICFKGGNYHVGTLQTNGGPVTGLGFKPQGIILGSAGRAESTTDVSTDHSEKIFGFASDDTASSSVGSISVDGVSTSVTAVASYLNRVYVNQSTATPPVVEGWGNVSSYDADGFTITYTDPDPSASFAFFFAVRTGAAHTSGYDPYSRGTLLSKWTARNPYKNYPIETREGKLGTPWYDLAVRHYLLTKLDPSGRDGTYRLTARDIFSQVDPKKAMCPKPQRGELQAAIGTGTGTFTLSPAGIGNAEYAASGFGCIGAKECISYTRSGDVITMTARGQLGTVAQSHAAEDKFQDVYSEVTQSPHHIAHRQLVLFAGFTERMIDLEQWNIAGSAIAELFTRHIAIPTPVFDLVGELMEEARFTLVPNIATGRIDLIPLRAAAPIASLEEGADIIGDELTARQQDERRVSQVHVHYAPRDPTLDLQDPNSYRSSLLIPDFDAEGPTQYNAKAIRTVFAPWIPQFGRAAAESCGESIMQIYRDPPWEVDGETLTSKLTNVEPGRFIQLTTEKIPDFTGLAKASTLAVTMINRGAKRTRFNAQGVSFLTSSSGEREIYIENIGVLNFVLRTIHDTVYAPATSGVVVRCIIEPGINVGSGSTDLFSFDTGFWPAGVILFLDINGRVQGRGGRGGDGGHGAVHNIAVASTSAGNGTNGEKGGPAMKIRHPITINSPNGAGQIWAGGGASPGGGGAAIAFTGFEGTSSNAAAAGGNAGAGGQGSPPGPSGTPGGASTPNPGVFPAVGGFTPSAATTEAPGPAVAGNTANFASGTAVATGGANGIGGQKATAGGASSAGSTSFSHPDVTQIHQSAGSPGSPGPAGVAIEGIGFVTYGANPPDVQGATV
jgi:hypothetical protein